jgi:glycosyltransferase involved in cell wall biosynthesis
VIRFGPRGLDHRILLEQGRFDMVIGVEALPFCGMAAGVSRYMRELLDRIMVLCPEDEFVFYSPMPAEVPLTHGRWRVRIPDTRGFPGHWLRDVLPRMVADDRVDIFWGQNTSLPLRLARPCRRVLTVHDLTGIVCPRTMRLSHRLTWSVNFRAAVRAADAVVAVSMATERLIRRLTSVPQAMITVVYEGNPSILVPLPSGVARSLVKERFSLTGDFMLAVGTIEPRKDYQTLLDALRSIRSAPPLVIVGAVGWNCRGILKAIREAEADGMVRYLGRASDEELAALYSAAQVTIYPSFYEGFGLPVLEAMACGCPVLCSWSSSLPEVGGRAASYFRPRDAADLARRLDALLRDEGRLVDMREKGIAQAACFSFDRAAEQMVRVLRGEHLNPVSRT